MEEVLENQEVCDGCALRFARVIDALERKEWRLEHKNRTVNSLCDLLTERERLLNERLHQIEKREARVAHLEYIIDECIAT